MANWETYPKDGLVKSASEKAVVLAVCQIMLEDAIQIAADMEDYDA